MGSKKQTTPGFTIVELLIVIVVIGILAAITIVAYTDIQVRARDTIRSDSIAKIKRALELYKVDYGQYPNATVNPGYGGWELSTDVAGTFMEALMNKGYLNKVPLDPLNDAVHNFWYYRYPPGTYGCPIENGGFYIIRVAAYESVTNKPTSGNSVSCPTGSQSDPGPTNSMYLYTSYEKL